MRAYAQMREGGGVRFKNTIFVVSRSDTYIVSIQQILCSALSRGFEPCSAAREHMYKCYCKKVKREFVKSFVFGAGLGKTCAFTHTSEFEYVI